MIFEYLRAYLGWFNSKISAPTQIASELPKQSGRSWSCGSRAAQIASCRSCRGRGLPWPWHSLFVVAVGPTWAYYLRDSWAYTAYIYQYLSAARLHLCEEMLREMIIPLGTGEGGNQVC